MDKSTWLAHLDWLSSPIGQLLLETEAKEIFRVIADRRLGRFGLNYLPTAWMQATFKPVVETLLAWQPYPPISLNSASTSHTSMTSTTTTATTTTNSTQIANAPPPPRQLVSDALALPLLDHSISFVLMPHVVEYVDDPAACIKEAVDVLTGQGMIVITGFNPSSFWGIKKWFTPRKMPYLGKYLALNRVRRILVECDCQLLQTRTVFFRLPVMHAACLRYTRFLEILGRLCWPTFGGSYVIIAQKRIMPLMPIRERWQVKSLLINKGLISPTSRIMKRGE